MPTPHNFTGQDQPTLYDSLWCAAHWIWERRETAKNAGFPFSEETITETVLLDLATQHPRDIQIVPFNKREEGKLGADWEWLFFSRDQKKFFRSLVQAKVLADADDQYAHIDRTIGNTGVRQIDRLLATAKARGIPALYTFYNHLHDQSRVPVKACPCWRCVGCWGCSVALAKEVHARLPSKKFDVLRDISMPWLCLLCENGRLASATAPERAAMGFLRLHRLAATERAEVEAGAVIPPLQELIRSNPPEYFSHARDLRYVDSASQREATLRRMAAENPGIDGLVLLTDSEGWRTERSDTIDTT